MKTRFVEIVRGSSGATNRRFEFTIPLHDEKSVKIAVAPQRNEPQVSRAHLWVIQSKRASKFG
jgi:hypothetical protein